MRHRECGRVFVANDVVVEPGGTRFDMKNNKERHFEEARVPFETLVQIAHEAKAIFWCPSCGLAHFIKVDKEEVYFSICP